MKTKTLYISDLDGTLLNSNKEVSGYTRDTLNSLIKNGVHFSIATARTAASAIKILSGLNLNLPVVLMNGVVVYDIPNGNYIKIESIPQETVINVIRVLKEHALTGFMYSINNNDLTTYYEALNTQALKDFYDERITKYYKSFEQTESFLDKVSTGKTVYFAVINEYDKLISAFNSLKKYPNIDSVLYRDIYANDLWYLEIHSNTASKYTAAKYLREYGRFDKVVGFGDNLNDIPLFRACEESYAMSNAVEELKEIATGIIASNNEDGVARFIAQKEL